MWFACVLIASELSILNSNPSTSVRLDKTGSNLLLNLDVNSVCLRPLVVTTFGRAAVYRPSTFVPSMKTGVIAKSG